MIAFRGRKVCVGQVTLEIGEGAYCEDATWEDTGAELTEAELTDFNECCAGELYEEAYIDASARAYDRAKAARYDD